MIVLTVESCLRQTLHWSVMFVFTLVQSRSHVDTVQNVLHIIANSSNICWSHTMKELGWPVTCVRRNSSTIIISNGICYDMTVWSHLCVTNVKSVSLPQMNWNDTSQYTPLSNSFAVVYVGKILSVNIQLKFTSEDVFRTCDVDMCVFCLCFYLPLPAEEVRQRLQFACVCLCVCLCEQDNSKCCNRFLLNISLSIADVMRLMWLIWRALDSVWIVTEVTMDLEHILDSQQDIRINICSFPLACISLTPIGVEWLRLSWVTVLTSLLYCVFVLFAALHYIFCTRVERYCLFVWQCR